MDFILCKNRSTGVKKAALKNDDNSSSFKVYFGQALRTLYTYADVKKRKSKIELIWKFVVKAVFI